MFQEENKVGNKLLLIFLFIITCLVTQPVKALNAHPHNKLENMVVFSVSCSAKPGNMIYLITSADNTRVFRIPFTCHSPSEGQVAPELKYMRLSPGIYYFSGIAQHIKGDKYLATTTFHPIVFAVKPGVVSYVGRHVLTGGEDELPPNLLGVNAADEDIPVFKKATPMVTAPVEIQNPRIMK